MSLSLSVFIPDENLSLKDKEHVAIHGSGLPVLKNKFDDSLWSVAVYEVWQAPCIYIHLKFIIQELIYNIKKANKDDDFSIETYKNIGLELIKIGEGFKMLLSEFDYFSAIFPLFQELSKTNQDYNEKFNKAKLTEIYQKIYKDVVQSRRLQRDQMCVDIQTSERKDKFLKEKEKLLEEIKIFNILGGSKEEIKSLDYLMDGWD
jgi:hypothetical protein